MATNPTAIALLVVTSLAASAALRSDWPHHAVTSIASGMTANVSGECQADLQLYTQGLGELESWALKMFDASGKIPDGIITEWNIIAQGSRSSCLEVEAKEEAFRGRHCVISINQRMVAMPLEPFPEEDGFPLKPDIRMPAFSIDDLLDLSQVFRFGMCVPDSCSREDLSLAIEEFLDDSSTGNNLTVYSANVISCDACSDHVEMDGYKIAFLTATATLVTICLLGTAIDTLIAFGIMNASKNIFMRLLLGCSLYTNGQKLFNVEKRPGHSQIHCLHGMRFLSMSWVIIGHVYGFSLSLLPFKNYVDIAPGPSNFLFNAMRNAEVSVDSFFFMSGCLLAYLTLKEMDALKKRSQGKVSASQWASFWTMYYVHRYLRLTGALLFISVFHATMLEYLEFGWGDWFIRDQRLKCEADWMWNPLYVMNYVGDHYCVGQVWYLSTEFQMFLVTPLIIFALWRYRNFGPASTLGWGIISVAIPFILSIIYNFPANGSWTGDSVPKIDWNMWYYQSPFCRFQPYWVGIILGYILHVTKNKEIKISWLMAAIGWLVAAFIALSVLYGISYDEYFESGKEIGLPKSAHVMYASFSKLAWALALAWVVFACHRDIGGWVNDFLSWEAFIPLSRLTYTAYLAHMTILCFLYCYVWYPLAFTQYLMSLLSMMVVGITIAVSIPFSLFVEVPLMNIEKILLTPRKG